MTGTSTEPADDAVLVQESGSGRYAQTVAIGRHRLAADEPSSVGGDDSGPSPYDLVLAGLGACTTMTLRMYAERKGWPLERVTVRLWHSRVHAKDCANCETTAGMLDHIDRRVHMEGPLDGDQRSRLLEIADKCPVHRTLHAEVIVRTTEDEPTE